MDLSSAAWALLGGSLIGTSASVLLYFNGKVAGVSGIVGNVRCREVTRHPWRVFFVLGLVVGGAVMFAVAPARFALDGTPSLALTAVAGLLVGIGTRVGSGCTSGHGVCGLARVSPRSLVATLAFISTGIVTATAARMLGGAS